MLYNPYDNPDKFRKKGVKVTECYPNGIANAEFYNDGDCLQPNGRFTFLLGEGCIDSDAIIFCDPEKSRDIVKGTAYINRDIIFNTGGIKKQQLRQRSVLRRQLEEESSTKKTSSSE